MLAIRALNVKRGCHRLQNTWIATFCCETSRKLSCSGTREEDREPPSPTISSTRSTTKQSLQPVGTTSKKMIQDMGSVELFELFETDLRRSAKNAYHNGVKALSIALAGIS